MTQLGVMVRFVGRWRNSDDTKPGFATQIGSYVRLGRLILHDNPPEEQLVVTDVGRWTNSSLGFRTRINHPSQRHISSTYSLESPNITKLQILCEPVKSSRNRFLSRQQTAIRWLNRGWYSGA